MSDLLIDVDDDVNAEIECLAKEHGRTMGEEVLEMLKDFVRRESTVENVESK